MNSGCHTCIRDNVQVLLRNYFCQQTATKQKPHLPPKCLAWQRHPWSGPQNTLHRMSAPPCPRTQLCSHSWWTHSVVVGHTASFPCQLPCQSHLQTHMSTQWQSCKAKNKMKDEEVLCFTDVTSPVTCLQASCFPRPVMLLMKGSKVMRDLGHLPA